MFISIPIIATKLFPPPTRAEIVRRTGLIERLNDSLHCRLTLISAPAGFGKSTLVSEWVNGCERPTAWLSLDEGDNDPVRFLVYLITALQTVVETIGAGILAVLQSPPTPPTESLLTSLLNEIATVPCSFTLVLDDYHLVDSQPVDKSLAFLIEHLPPRLHLVIVTREDPPLPLARLRARGYLSEFRATDLRFTPTEVAGFLNKIMGLNLTPPEINALEVRTEGWIAGLQLAAISLQGHSDTTGFIRSFTGSHRYILDYLIEEVLQQQPESIQKFLLSTSILSRLCGSLCDALLSDATGTGQETLKQLDQANLFVVPLDDKRQWYRYHHLFGDVLQARLSAEQQDQISVLHLRACEWYEQNDMRGDAIRHALAAENYERAAELAELAWSAMDRSFQSATWLGWVKLLPDELIRVRPVLSAGYGWALLDNGELEGAEARLRDAEMWLERTSELSGGAEDPAAKMIVVDEEEFQSLSASIATARAFHAQALGEVSATVKQAGRALELLPGNDHTWRGMVAAILGLAYWANGDLEEAHQSFSDAMAALKLSGNIPFAISSTFVRADIRVVQGRLSEAVSIYESSLELAREAGEPLPAGTEELYRGLGELSCERGDLEAATQQLQTCRQLGEQVVSNDWRHRWCAAQARLCEAQGDLAGALSLLEEAERLFQRTPVPNLRPLAARKTRIWIVQGRIAAALKWIQERGLSTADDLSYLLEFEHITLARVLIAQQRSNPAAGSIQLGVELLERLLQAAEAGGRMGSMIEILLLQALAEEVQENFSSALVFMERCLRLAEPEGYLRIFVDEGRPMEQLLSAAVEEEIKPDYAARLLRAFQTRQSDESSSLFASAPGQPLVEPLSQRELEILNLIARGLSNQDISQRLFRALSTVKGHNMNIFGKLGVQNRTEAVARARELGLIN